MYLSEDNSKGTLILGITILQTMTKTSNNKIFHEIII